jgi:hypothetical protein
MMMRNIQFGSGRTMSTPSKMATLVFGLVVLLPIFALLIVAGIFAGVVFGILLLVGVVNTKIRTLFSKTQDGRKNVRIRRK